MDHLSTLNLGILQEPRGFIRVLQFVFSICAFATTTNFGSSFRYIVTCKNDTMGPVKISQPIGYPFKFDHIAVEESVCGQTYSFNYFGDYASDAEFFVAAGVLAMFYSLGSLAFYCFFDAKYQSDKSLPLVDFIVTMVLAVFWLSGSAAWASGLSSVKYVCNPDNFLGSLQMCKDNLGKCATDFAGNFAGLNISIIFGFLNFFLWAVNLWFLYKETSWFQGMTQSSGPGVQSPTV